MSDTFDEQIILAMNAVYLHFGDWSFSDLEAGFKAVERQFASVLDEEDLLEVKRRVAEATLSAAQMTKQPIERCLALLGHVEQLGWSNIYGKSLVLGALIRYCLNNGRKDVGLHLLVPMLAEVEQDSTYAGQESWETWLTGLRTLLAELQA